MTCPNPLDAVTLADYWLGQLPQPEEDAVDEHLFSCDACGDRLREVIALAEGLRSLAREGSLRMIVSDAFLQRATAEGLRVRQYTPAAGGSVQCTVTAEDDLLIGNLPVDLHGAARVDLSICDSLGREQFRLPDIPVNPAANHVALQESITMAKAAPSNTLIMRLVAVEHDGAEMPLGEYTFHHTRSLPDPGGI